MSDTRNNYKDPSGLTNWVRYMLFAQIFVAIISIGSNLLEYQLLSNYQTGVYSSQEKAVADGEANDKRQQFLGLIYVAVFFVSGVLILMWIHRANYNARQLGAQKMKFTPGWAIGYYFIPILTLWKPYQAMKEIWKASHNPNNWQVEKASPILGLWWFLFISASLLGQAEFRMSSSAKGVQDLIWHNVIAQISDVFEILLALVFLSIVNSIYKAQSTAHESANKAINHAH